MIKSSLYRQWLILPIFLVYSSFSGLGESAWSCPSYVVNAHLLDDVCWECQFPISVGSASLINGSLDLPDTENDPSMVCACDWDPFPKIGVSIGYWEPMAIVEISKDPGCFMNMMGTSISLGNHSTSGSDKQSTVLSSSFYYVHYYNYPIASLAMPYVQGGKCKTDGEDQLSYISELDPLWSDEELSTLFFTENLAFASPAVALSAQAACSVDALAANTGLPTDIYQSCAGSQGFMYPLTGFVPEHEGFAQATTLLAERTVFSLHRKIGFEPESDWILDTTPQDVCNEVLYPILKKSRYRYEMLYPMAQDGCSPFGRTTQAWESGTNYDDSAEYKAGGGDLTHESNQNQNAVFLIWRKRNCCLY
jgi:conjugal transfer pilus assembly protein TraU